MFDENFIDVIIAAVELAHRDARMPQKCSLYERGAVRRDAIEFLSWAQAEGRELAADFAHHIPNRAIRATSLWAMEEHEANAQQMYWRRANMKRRGKAGMTGRK